MSGVNDTSPVVSVIVPIYNSEDYLEVCLDSILSQTYKNLEIILVDDGSGDGSRAIIDTYAVRDSRVRPVLKDANEGINRARKTGFSSSTGDYIMFVDNDDIVSHLLVEEQLRILTDSKADISIGKTVWWNDRDDISIDETLNQGSGDIEVLNKKLSYRSLITETSPFSDSEVGILWNKIHKRSLFSDYDWDLSNMPAEDFMTNARLFDRVNSVVYIDKVYYIHRVNSGTTMGRLGKKTGANSTQGVDIFDALYSVAKVFSEVSEANDWDFRNDITYFKYRYFYIRMEAFIANSRLSGGDFLKIKNYSSTKEINNMLSDEFRDYISKFVYHPASMVLGGLVEYWSDFNESDSIDEFLERRVYRLTDKLNASNQHIDMLESDINHKNEVLNYIQTLRGSLLNFLGKVKHRAIRQIPRIHKIVHNRLIMLKKRYKYKDCWLVMDRVDSASDNGYSFYTYLLKQQPDINAFFVINRNSPDVPRLIREGFRLVFVGTDDHKIALEQSSKLFYAYFTFEYVNDSAQRFFLGHGITKDDLPNPGLRKGDYFITVLDREQEYLSERVDMKAIKIGLPRYDSLVSEIDDYTGKKTKVVIAPTWRPWLRSELSNLEKSSYYTNWNNFLNSDALKSLANSYEVVFVLHPMMVGVSGAGGLFSMPKYIESTTYQGLGLGGLQSLLIETKLLVTDFSSISFDAALSGADVVYFQFDKNDFRERGHLKEGWFSYEVDGFGPVLYHIDDLNRYIKKYGVSSKLNSKYRNRTKLLQEEIRESRGASERLVELATKR